MFEILAMSINYNCKWTHKKYLSQMAIGKLSKWLLGWFILELQGRTVFFEAWWHPFIIANFTFTVNMKW